MTTEKGMGALTGIECVAAWAVGVTDRDALAADLRWRRDGV